MEQKWDLSWEDWRAICLVHQSCWNNWKATPGRHISAIFNPWDKWWTSQWLPLLLCPPHHKGTHCPHTQRSPSLNQGKLLFMYASRKIFQWFKEKQLSFFLRIKEYFSLVLAFNTCFPWFQECLACVYTGSCDNLQGMSPYLKTLTGVGSHCQEFDMVSQYCLYNTEGMGGGSSDYCCFYKTINALKHKHHNNIVLWTYVDHA